MAVQNDVSILICYSLSHALVDILSQVLAPGLLTELRHTAMRSAVLSYGMMLLCAVLSSRMVLQGPKDSPGIDIQDLVMIG
eukprot:3321045-Rhodomonas_salina.1